MSFSSVYGLKIFSGIETALVDSILEKCPRVQFRAGVNIMEQGEVSSGKCYVILIGSVSVIFNEKVIRELGFGDIFGEMALMSDEPRSATIKTLTEVEAIEMSSEEIFSIIQNDENSLSKEIMRRMEENLERE